jgi:uncharacterized protein (TIGR01777 family)
MSEKFALITGASGLLGKLINEKLKQAGYTTIGLQHRKPVPTTYSVSNLTDIKAITVSLDLIINLAGAPIAAGLWSNKRKSQLRASRIQFTQDLVNWLDTEEVSCRHFISGSAIGFYGTGAAFKDETSPEGNDFSANLCQDWEREAHKLKKTSKITTLVRTGLVLAPKGGFLTPFKLTTKFGLGAVLGRGDQGISWIDYRDWVSAVMFILENKAQGTFNLTAPNPVSQREFANTIASAMNRPRVFKIPSFTFAPLGEMKTLFIDGQFIIPKRLVDEGYTFKHPSLESSVNSML